jgi:flagellar protein FlaG
MEINALTSTTAFSPIDPVRPSGPAEILRAAVVAIRALNKSEMMGSDRELQFARDKETKRPVVRIVQRETGEVLEQIPPEQVLKMLASLGQMGEE